MLGRKGGFGDPGERLKGWVSADWVEDPLTINPETGKLGIKRFAALSELTPAGELQLRTDGSIIQAPGSPVTAKAAVSPKVLDERVTEVVDTVTTLDARTTAAIVANTAAIAAEAVTRGDADTALDGRVTALEALPSPEAVASATQSYAMSGATVSIVAWPSTETALSDLTCLCGIRFPSEVTEIRLSAAYDGLGSSSGVTLALRAKQEDAESGSIALDSDPASYSSMVDGPADLVVDLAQKNKGLSSSGWQLIDRSNIPASDTDQWTLMLVMTNGDDSTARDVGTVVFQTR